MVKRKTPRKTARRAAPARRIYRRRAKKSGYDKIAPAMATVALAAVNAGKVKKLWNAATYSTGMSPAKIINRIQNDSGTKSAMKELVSVNSLVTDGVALAGGYIGGEVVRKYAPTVIKKPIAKLAKKIPKVI